MAAQPISALFEDCTAGAVATSTINRAGVAAGGTAAVATVAETACTVSEIKYSAQSLGDLLVPMLLIATCAEMVELAGLVQRVQNHRAQLAAFRW